MCEICGPQIKEIKIVGSLLNTNVNNALILANGTLQLGGNPLIKDTDIAGAYTLNLGTTLTRLTQLNIKASNQVLGEFSSGANTASILLNSSGILITDTTATPRGLLGSTNFQSNYLANSYVQKVYVDSRIVSKAISAILANPTVSENTYSITWDNTAGNFTLSASAAPAVPGANTQVIFNNGGALAGDPKLFYNVGGSFLSVWALQLGDPTYGAGDVIINSNGAGATIAIRISPKGNGNIILETGLAGTGIIQLGNAGGSMRTIRADGGSSLIDISLEPKGTEGIVYIGNVNEAGGFRYIGTRGSGTDIGLEIRPKGTGDILIGNNTVAYARNTIRASSSLNSTLRLASKSGIYADVDGIAGEFLLGGTTNGPSLILGSTATDGGTTRIINVRGTQANISLLIYSKGTGSIYLNDSTYKDYEIGNWNMNISAGGLLSVNVPHGLTIDKIDSVDVLIRNDANTFKSKLITGTTVDFTIQGYYYVNAFDVTLVVKTGGSYDNTNYDGTGFSRGRIRIWYKI